MCWSSFSLGTCCSSAGLILCSRWVFARWLPSTDPCLIGLPKVHYESVEVTSLRRPGAFRILAGARLCVSQGAIGTAFAAGAKARPARGFGGFFSGRDGRDARASAQGFSCHLWSGFCADRLPTFCAL